MAQQVQLGDGSEHRTNRRILLVLLDIGVPDVPKVLRLLGPLRDDVEAIIRAPDEDALDGGIRLPLEADRDALGQKLDVFLQRCRRRHFEVGNGVSVIGNVSSEGTSLFEGNGMSFGNIRIGSNRDFGYVKNYLLGGSIVQELSTIKTSSVKSISSNSTSLAVNERNVLEGK